MIQIGQALITRYNQADHDYEEHLMWVGMFFQIALIVSLAVWILTTALEGTLSAESAALVLVALVILSAIGKSQKWGLIDATFRIGLPIAAFLTFAIWKGQRDIEAISQILGIMLAIVIALFGIYVMIFRGFRTRRRKDDD